MTETLFETTKFSLRREWTEIKPGVGFWAEYVARVDGTRTIAQDEHGKLLISREYRFELKRYDWRLPGGKLDFAAEPIQSAAARELAEETGVVAQNWQHLWSTSPDANIRFKRHFFLATGLTQKEQNLDKGENVEVHWFSTKDALEMAFSGEISEEISALAIIRLASQQALLRII